MNARELIAMLSRLDPETRILVSSDEEGNSYHDVLSINADHNPLDGTFAVIWPDGREANLPGLERINDHLVTMSLDALLRLANGDEPTTFPASIFA